MGLDHVSQYSLRTSEDVNANEFLSHLLTEI